MTESATAPPPSLEEARGWIGYRVDEIAGKDIGLVFGIYADADDDKPSWLIVRQGRFRGTLVAIPATHCAVGSGRVWVADEGETIRNAPVVDPTRPLLREHELTICAHYGLGEGLGRAAGVAGRKEGSTTSRPA